MMVVTMSAKGVGVLEGVGVVARVVSAVGGGETPEWVRVLRREEGCSDL